MGMARSTKEKGVSMSAKKKTTKATATQPMAEKPDAPSAPPKAKCECCAKLEAKFNALVAELKRQEVINNPRPEKAVRWHLVHYPDGKVSD